MTSVLHCSPPRMLVETLSLPSAGKEAKLVELHQQIDMVTWSVRAHRVRRAQQLLDVLSRV